MHDLSKIASVVFAVASTIIAAGNQAPAGENTTLPPSSPLFHSPSEFERTSFAAQRYCDEQPVFVVPLDHYQTVRRPAKVGRGSLWDRVVADHRNYYDRRSFQLLTGGFLVGAAFANTQLDEQIQNHFQTSVRGATSDDWSEFLHADKNLGDGLYTLPIFATAWAAGAVFDESPILLTTGRWGERSLRSFLVGAPPLMLAQRLTGGSRPGETDRGSRWLPFQDNNGVSGHSFMAALPFINAAKMTENRWLKATFYAGSLLGPLSRINDNAHYPSQAGLGWWMAYVSATAIDRTEMANGSIQFYPYVADNSYGGMLEVRF